MNLAKQYAEATGFLGFMGLLCWGLMFLDFASAQ